MSSCNPGNDTVAILLATYYGARYLPEQLNSIARQTHSAWHLLVSDDGSTDGTLEILNRFSSQHPGQVSVVSRSEHTNGACGNFLHLVATCPDSYPYIVFCDQDDVWVDTKIATSLAAIKELEARYPGPCLVFTDAAVVDSELKELAPSFFSFTGVDSSRTKLAQLLVQNPISGAGMMMNAPLLSVVQQSAPCFDSKHIAMHDQWVGLIAACFGHIAPVNEPLYLYRQHGGNAMGAIQMSMGSVVEKAKIAKTSLEKKRNQAETLLECYRETLPESQAALLEGFVGLGNLPKGKRIRFCVKQGALMNGALRNIGLLLFV